MNKFIFSGHLGQDAIYKATQSGHTVLKFSVPARSGFGEKEQTTWINCDLWGKRADALQPYLLKGQQVIVAGEFSMEKWTDREGVERQTPCLKVEDIDLVGDKKAQQQNYYPTAQPINNQIPAYQQPAQQQQNNSIPAYQDQQSSGQNYRNKPSGKSSVYQNQVDAQKQQRANPQPIDYDDIPY